MRIFTASRHALLMVLAVAMVVVVPLPSAGAQQVDGRYRDFGDPGGFWSIVPPGQRGVINAADALAAQGGRLPDHVDDQLWMYDALTATGTTPGFTAADLPRVFKDGSFGVPDGDVGRVYAPGGRDDVVVLRDASHGVPRIFGDTREGAMFAAGYTAAEDRLFLMDVLRHVGRAELTTFLGPAPGNIALDRAQLATAPYTEEDLERQIEEGRVRHGALGEQLFADATAYVAGVNRYIAEALADPSKLPAEYPALQQVPSEFVPADLVAIASLVGGIFGKGGGREVANYCGIEALAGELGQAEARAVFDDLKLADDAEAPVKTRREFPYLHDLGPVDPAAIPDLDCGSLRPITAPPPGPEHAGEAIVDLVPTPPAPAPGGASASEGRTGVLELPWGRVPVELSAALSNALLVAGDRTDTGNPIAIFGPQTGYFMPQLLVEKEIHAPGISARGVSFAGTDVVIQLGRGAGYAWSATSAGADNVDQFVLRLCDPDGGEATTASMGYLHDGQCKQIEALQEVRLARPTAGGLPGSPEDLRQVVVNKYFERAPDYGPLTARGTLSDGTPIAIAVARSTYFDELGSARGFMQVNDPEFMADGVDAFRRAFGQGVDYTFNWFYVDADDIAFQVSCRCPQRAAGVDPYLPAWGTGQWDWEGFVGFDALPWDVNPEQGYLLSWNNKQAPGFRSSDAQFGWGPIHRSDKLERRLVAALADGPLDIGAAVDVMALAATTDLRAQELMDLLAAAMGSPPDGADARVADVWQRLRAWAGDDLGHRRDHDRDGAYEHAVAIAVMDAWWEPLTDAMFLDASADARRVLGIRLHDAPQNHLGSAFQDSFYAHVHKDLRQVLGHEVADPFSRSYCGAGDLGACRDALWASLGQAVEALEDEFGSQAVDDWRRTPADDAIIHSAIGVVSVPPIGWQNRPTYQQVVQIPAAAAPPPPSAAQEPPVPAPAVLPATGGAGVLALLGVALAGLALAARRSRREESC